MHAGLFEIQGTFKPFVESLHPFSSVAYQDSRHKGHECHESISDKTGAAIVADVSRYDSRWFKQQGEQG